MSGEGNGTSRGIIPRAVEQMISEMIILRQNGWDVSLTTSMVRACACTYECMCFHIFFQ